MLIFFPMDIGKTLSALLEKGLTQVEIAAELGCSQPTVSGMVRGKVGRARPSYKIVEGIKRLATEKGVALVPEEHVGP